MLDIRLIREQLDTVKERLGLVGCDPAEVQAVSDLDELRRRLLAEVESMRAERNKASKDIGRMKPGPEQDQAKAQVRSLGDRMAEMEGKLAAVDERFQAAMLELPNLPHTSVPVGKDDSENKFVREEGTTRTFDLKPVPLWDLGPRWGVIDVDRGVKVSGRRC